MELKDKTVLVIGCGRLGRALVAGLQRLGAQVLAGDVNPQVLDSLTQEFGTDGNVTPLEIDVRSKDSLREASDALSAKGGSPGMVVCTESKSGGKRYEPLETYQLEDWNRLLELHLTGTFLATQAVGAMMAARGGGSIVTYSSIYGVVAPDQRIYEGQPHYMPAPYATAKAGIIGLTQYLATYWCDRNVRVNCVSPGGVQAGQSDAFVERYSNRTPLGRMAAPEDVVGLTALLLSDDASYITGQNILVDGGLTAW